MKPSDGNFLALVGPKAKLWTELRGHLATHYGGHQPELSVGRKEYDWTIRYRRAGKTLVTLMPEPGGFCVLVVLGKDEDAKAEDLILSENVAGVYHSAKQFHDGRWLWIRPKTKGDLASIAKLLAVKRRPDSR
jgi:hypothetical protein